MSASTDALDTIRAQIAFGAAQIGRFEAMLLLGHAIGRTREFLIAHDDETLDEESILRYHMLITLRSAGTPIPYITGRQEFFGRYFEVNDAVLIPRPDTEVLVEQALLVAPAKPRILDLGTGSGCIAITLALEISGAEVTATDASAAALATAERNARALGASVRFREGFWWDAVPQKDMFEVVVSNPPYIRPDDEHLANLGNEPLGALTDGIDGLATGVTMPVMLFFTAVACFWGQLELGIFSAGLFGGLCGFLIYNFHPAKVFMGDTGSLFLGGAVCGLAFALDIPLVLILVGIIYILETLSDILQVGYFKLTHGKRIFRMAPLHHHLELGGWSEVKLFCVFSGVTLLACVLAFLGVMGR